MITELRIQLKLVMSYRLVCLLWLTALLLPPGQESLARAAEAHTDTDRMVADIARAVQRGSARDISRFFSNNVDLSMPRAEGTFSKSQSEMILRDFFSRNKPASYSISHQDSLRDGSIYIIGRLSTEDGNTFRCYFLIKKVSESYFLHHIQIELQ